MLRMWSFACACACAFVRAHNIRAADARRYTYMHRVAAAARGGCCARLGARRVLDGLRVEHAQRGAEDD